MKTLKNLKLWVILKLIAYIAVMIALFIPLAILLIIADIIEGKPIKQQYNILK